MDELEKCITCRILNTYHFVAWMGDKAPGPDGSLLLFWSMVSSDAMHFFFLIGKFLLLFLSFFF